MSPPRKSPLCPVPSTRSPSTCSLNGGLVKSDPVAPAQVFQLSETALRSKEREGPRAKPGLGQEYSEGTVSVLTQETHLPSQSTPQGPTLQLFGKD